MPSNDEPGLRASLVLPYLVWFVFFHFILHLFFITKHGLGCFTSCFTCSSLLGILWVFSRHPSLVHHYLAWFVLFHFLLHWFIITWHGLLQTMPSDDEPVKQEVKQYKPCQVMMNQ
jgi:hypothetical protein